MAPIQGATFIQPSPDNMPIQEIIYATKGDEYDVVLSDMAPSTISDKQTNHIRIMSLAEMALDVTDAVLRNGGTFMVKIFRGEEEEQFRGMLANRFTKVKPFKPSATSRGSAEMYYVCQGYVPAHLR